MNALLTTLIVEDNPLDARIIQEILRTSEGLSFAFVAATSLAAALEIVETRELSLILLDLSLPDSQGLKTYESLRAKATRTPIIVLSGLDDEKIAMETVHRGAQDYLVKGGANRTQILRAIRYALERSAILSELVASQQQLQKTQQELLLTLDELKNELTTAQTVQRSFLPRHLDLIPNLDIAAEFCPCSPVSGDLYDVYMLDGNRTLVLMLDVCGHGVPAGLIAAMAKLSFTRNYLQEQTPQKIVTAVNRELCGFLPPERYICAFCALIDTDEHSLAYVRCAMPQPLIVHNNGSIAELDQSNAFLGVDREYTYVEKTVPFCPSDLLFLYTDGLVEQQNSAGDFFGKQRLMAALNQKSGQTAQQTIDIVKAAHEIFYHPSRQTDDITMVCATY